MYVYDMFIISTDMNELIKLKQLLRNEFEMKDLGLTRGILGMDIKRDKVKSILTLS